MLLLLSPSHIILSFLLTKCVHWRLFLCIWKNWSSLSNSPGVYLPTTSMEYDNVVHEFCRYFWMEVFEACKTFCDPDNWGHKMPRYKNKEIKSEMNSPPSVSLSRTHIKPHSRIEYNHLYIVLPNIRISYLRNNLLYISSSTYVN